MRIAILNLTSEEPKDKKLAKAKASILSAYFKDGTLISEIEDPCGMTEYKFSINPVKHKKCKPAHPGLISYDYPSILPWGEWKTYNSWRDMCAEACTCHPRSKHNSGIFIYHHKSYSTASKDHTADCKAQEIIKEGGFA